MSSNNDSSILGIDLSQNPPILNTCIKNPCQKLKNIVIRNKQSSNYSSTSYTSSTKEKTKISCSDKHTRYWGDIMQAKHPDHTRVFFQNINGLSTKDFSKWHTSLEWLRNNNIDVTGLAEPCINTRDPHVRNSYSSKINTYQQRSYIKFAPNTNPSDSRYQPGGSLMLCSEQWRSRIVRTTVDQRKWGRFVGFTFRLTNIQFLSVITAYRCVSQANNSIGKKTSLRYQRDQIAKEGISKTARSLCLDDLSEIVSDIHQTYGIDTGVLILIDANESKDEPNSQLPDFLRKHQLVDAITTFHDISSSISTQERSTSDRCIDYAFCSKDWMKHIAFCGYFPFYGALDSDHRGLYIDFNFKSLKDNKEYVAPQRIIGSNESDSTIIKYQNYIHEQFNNHRIMDKATELATNFSGTNDHLIKQIDKLDKQITEIVLSSERLCAPKRCCIRWNPGIANISLVIKYFKLKAKLHSSPATATVLDSIWKQIQEPYKTEICQSIDPQGNPQKEKAKALKIKRDLINAMKSSREDQYYKTACRQQSQLSRDNFKTQLYFKQCHRNIKVALGKGQYSTLTTIETPITIDGTTTWKTLSDPTLIEDALITRNIDHFGQAHESPFASSPLATELGFEGVNSASRDLLCGKLPSTFSTCDDTTQLILEKFMLPPKTNIIDESITYNEFYSALKHWDEKTTTSPSGRHLGHYRVLLHDVLDKDEIEQKNAMSTGDMFESRASIILKVYYHMLCATIKSGHPMNRWLTSHTSMIQKTSGCSRLDRLRVIHIYEADYNLFLKIYWGRKLVHNSEAHELLNEGQYGSRPGKRCGDQVLKKILVYEYASTTRSPFATMDNDAKSCFDRIICLFATLISMFYGLAYNIVKIQAETLSKMRYVTKTALGPSSKTYSHTPSTPIHGTGQGSCSSPALWLHSSSFLMDILDDHSYGFRASSPEKKVNIKVHNQGFVDDTSIMVNGGTTPAELVLRLQHDAQTWSNLLSSSGGLLQLSKCLYYIVDFQFDNTGNPIMIVPEHTPLQVTTGTDITPQFIQIVQPEAAHKTLGCLRTLDGNESIQFRFLLEKSKDWAALLQKRYLSRQEAWMVYHTYYMPQVLYSIMPTNMTKVQCDSIQSPVINAILPLLGFNRHTARDIIFGPTKYGGLGMLDLHTELYTRKREQIISHTRDPDSSIGKLCIINLGYLQLIIGKSTPYLESTIPIKYIQNTWFSELHLFLITHELTIKIKEIWKPTLKRTGDKILMDSVDLQPMDRVQVINNWRLYFQITNLSDLTDPEGKRICDIYLKYPSTEVAPSHPTRSTNLMWPRQGKPSKRSFCYWRSFISSVANCDSMGRLQKPLGLWYIKSPQDSKWKSYANHNTLFVLYQTTTYIQYDLCQEQRGQSSFTRTNQTTSVIPNDCIPVTPKTNGVSMTVRTETIPRQEIIPIASYDTFDQYLNSIDSWEERLLSSWWSVDTPAILKYLLHENIFLVVSDGGCKSPKGSYGMVLGTITKEQIATVTGIVKGSPTTITSFRCEAYGMLASFVFLRHLCLYFKIKGNNRCIQYHCDGYSLLQRISANRYKRMRNKDLLKDDLDLELQILAEIRRLETMGFRITINFVRGHQKLTPESPPEQIFNHVSDELATSTLKLRQNCLPYDLLPTMSVIIEFNKLLISGKIRHTIQHLALFPNFCNATAKQLTTSIPSSKLWWNVSGKTLSRFSRSDRFRLVKFNFNLLNTKSKEHQYDPTISPICPTCTTEIESSLHLIQCKCLHSQRQDLLDKLLKTTQSSLKNHVLSTCIYAAVGSVVNNTPVPTLDSLHVDSSAYLEEAYTHQCIIGWDQFCKGRWSIHWEALLNHELYLASQTLGKKTMGSEKWASNVLHDIWTGLLECWEHRNQLVHGTMPFRKQMFIRSQIMKEVNEHIQRNRLEDGTTTIDDFRKKTIPWIIKWLRHQRGKRSLDQFDNNQNSVAPT
jgi:hypothetical protein